MLRTRAALVGLLLAPGCALSEHEDGLSVAIALTHAGAIDAVALDAAFVTFTTIELTRCPGARHAPGTPTRLGVPVVEDLLAPPAPRLLGTLGPAPGRYCGVRVTVGPADADALGLDQAPGMLGLSLRLDGQVGERELHASCATGQTVEVAIDPIELSARLRHADLLLSIDASRLLESVDLAHPDAEVIGCAAAANAVRSLTRVAESSGR